MEEKRQKILVLQQRGSGEKKIVGLREFGGDQFSIETLSLPEDLPPVVDDAAEYLPEKIEADLVLDFLKHPDLSWDLAELCDRNSVPVVASGKKSLPANCLTPPT